MLSADSAYQNQITTTVLMRDCFNIQGEINTFPNLFQPTDDMFSE